MIDVANLKLDRREALMSLRATTILVSGARGLVGTALTSAIAGQGMNVRRLARRSSKSRDDDAVIWNPESGLLNFVACSGVEAVVHLAGENIASGRWTPAKKLRIRDRRVIGTHRLCKSLASMPTPPRVLVCASAIGYYGERGEQLLVETEPPGRGFLPEVCTQWERATQPAVDAGIRVVNLPRCTGSNFRNTALN